MRWKIFSIAKEYFIYIFCHLGALNGIIDLILGIHVKTIGLNKKCHLRKSQLLVNTGQRLSTFGLWRDRESGDEHWEVNYYIYIYIFFFNNTRHTTNFTTKLLQIEWYSYVIIPPAIKTWVTRKYCLRIYLLKYLNTTNKKMKKTQIISSSSQPPPHHRS